MKKRDFVITSLQGWDIEIGSAIKNYALEISKENRVLYVNTPMDHATWIRKNNKPSYVQRMDVIKGRKPTLRKINENLWILDCPFMVYSVNKIPIAFLFDFFNKINNRMIGKLIAKTITSLGFTNFTHIIDTDIYRSFYLKEHIKPALSVYYRRDYIIGESYWRKHGKRLEPMLIRKCDLVIANSLHYAKESSVYNANAYDLAMGVDLSLYDAQKQYDIPTDIAAVPHPIVGYVGTINSMRLDAALLLNAAKERPGYSFVLTGPQDAFFQSHPLHELPNVYFLGRKEVSELPGYVMVYDVCINPQKVNDMTIGNYPLKIDEYLALGKPTVATKTDTMVHYFNDYVLLSDSQQSFVALLDQAVGEIGDRSKETARLAFACTRGWESSTRKLYEILDRFEQQTIK